MTAARVRARQNSDESFWDRAGAPGCPRRDGLPAQAGFSRCLRPAARLPVDLLAIRKSMGQAP